MCWKVRGQHYRSAAVWFDAPVFHPPVSDGSGHDTALAHGDVRCSMQRRTSSAAIGDARYLRSLHTTLEPSTQPYSPAKPKPHRLQATGYRLQATAYTLHQEPFDFHALLRPDSVTRTLNPSPPKPKHGPINLLDESISAQRVSVQRNLHSNLRIRTVESNQFLSRSYPSVPDFEQPIRNSHQLVLQFP